jgi:O-antigen/teichoic acid export membrane protein
MQNSKKSKGRVLANQSFIYGLGNALQSFAGFIFLPFFTKYYSTEEFGVYSLILSVSSIANSIFFLGASSALTRYYYENDNIEHRKIVGTNSFILVLIGSITLIILGFLFSTKISILISNVDYYNNHILLIVIATSFNIILNFNLVILRLEKKSVEYISCSFGSFALNLVLLFFTLIILKLQIFAPILSSFLVNFIFLIVTSFLIRSKIDFDYYNLKELKSYLKFGLVIIGIGMLYSILDSTDRFVIKSNDTLSNVGIYSFGQRISGLINVFFIVPASLVWSVYRMQYYKDSSFNYLSAKIFTYFLNTGLMIILFFELFFLQLVTFFNLKIEYLKSFELIPVLMLVGLLYGCTTYLEFGLIVRNKLYYYIIIYIVGIFFYWITSNFFIDRFGIISIAYSKVLVFSIILFVLHSISKKFYSLPLKEGKVFSPFVFILVSFLFLNEISMLPIVVKFLAISICLILTYHFILFPEDKIRLKKYLLSSLR